jgi:stage II sporulation protein D
MKKTLAVMLAILSLATVAPPAAKASAPSGTIMKIGLSYDSSVLPSGNLQNVSGAGSGFEFGYFDGNGKFVSIGAKYEDTSITVLMDRNMSWHPGAGGGYGEYRENLDGTAIIGCFHIQLTGGYETFGAAKATADEYADSFIKYASGAFFVCVGHYLTRADAESAIASKGWVRCAVEAGTSNTVTVAKTGTSTIIFEYDGGGSRPLGVMPVSAGGEKCETWFRGNRYRGGFQYNRRSGDKLTVINFISIEEYIKGVVPYEMSNTWPMEALKAQACCARTFAESTRNRHGSSGFDLCPNEHCQAYRRSEERRVGKECQ